MRRQHSFLLSGTLAFICLSLIVLSFAGCGGGSRGTPKPASTSLSLPSAPATTVPRNSPSSAAPLTGAVPVVTPLNDDAEGTASAALIAQSALTGLSFVPVTPCRIAD